MHRRASSLLPTQPRLLCPLFVPGNRGDMLDKAHRYDASAFVPDFEDSVPRDAKDDAVATTASRLQALTALGVPIIPRVNGLATGRTMRELAAVVGTGIAGISIGKIDSAADIRHVARLLDHLEAQRGVAIGSTALLPWIETAAGVSDARAICQSSDRVRWVAFGAEDFAADMGIARAVDTGDADDSAADDSLGVYGEPSLLYARSAVAIAARASGVQALDTPYVRFRDADGLARESRLARRLGYSGKFAIHPAQNQPIRDVWRPSDAEIERARRVIRAAEQASSEGRGAIALDGEMIDAPVVARAHNTLADAGIAPYANLIADNQAPTEEAS